MDRADSWFSAMATDGELPGDVVQALQDVGFVVVVDPIVQTRVAELSAAYDRAMLAADSHDVSIGRTTTRVHDFVNRGPAFDALYINRFVLAACCSVIAQPFKLSTMHARTVHPGSPAQGLHVDFRRASDGWPMVGFIIMVDEFRHENGATRFVPGSHLWPGEPGDMMADPTTDYEGQVLACGAAGSIVIFNGSVWHGHAANRTGKPRRSIQAAYIRRGARASVDQAARIRPDTFERIGGLAKYVLSL
jgi:ectoine hydroxylase-related dioxygenase (phytanoyl-CoA dioxygenase family)